MTFVEHLEAWVMDPEASLPHDLDGENVHLDRLGLWVAPDSREWKMWMPESLLIFYVRRFLEDLLSFLIALS